MRQLPLFTLDDAPTETVAEVAPMGIGAAAGFLLGGVAGNGLAKAIPASGVLQQTSRELNFMAGGAAIGTLVGIYIVRRLMRVR